MKFDMSFSHKLILASNSPRRQELLASLDLPYEVRIIPDIDESYPEDLEKEKIAEFISARKAEAYLPSLKADELLITADTIVLLEDKVFGKPKDEDEACQMLFELSDRNHNVITGVTLATNKKRKTFAVSTHVSFGKLHENEIKYYVSKYKPFDKAGGYGIQEWIGFVAVKHISGSYFNVMGLPVHRLYHELKKFE